MSFVLRIALSSRRGLFCRRRSISSAPLGGSLAALLAALVRSGMARFLPPPRSACCLPAAVILVDGRPRPALGLLFGNSALLVSLGEWSTFRSCLTVYLDLSPRGMPASTI